MKKNKNNSNHQQSRASQAENRSLAILLLAVLFFLLALGVLAQAAGVDVMRNLGLGGSRMGTSTGTTNNRNGSNPGGAGSGGSQTNPGGNGTGSEDGSLNNLDVNVNSDTGLELDAGMNDGQLYVSPVLNPNPQGGTGAEGSVNDKKVIDTDSLLR